MEIIIYIIIGILAGAIIGWLLAKAKSGANAQAEKDAAQQKLSAIELEFAGYKATAIAELKTANDQIKSKSDTIDELSRSIASNQEEIKTLNNQLATATANHQAASESVIAKGQEVEQLKKELAILRQEWEANNRLLASAQSDNKSLEEKLKSQLQQIEELNKKFTTEFENIANKILDTKTQKFTDLNKENLKGILEPLGKNITDFKTKVEEVYDKESKERFSLGEKVKELAQLNKVISEEAHNLTRALKGEAKTQGRWGEMILESILEKSGLVKDREYFMEHELLDADGEPLKSDSEGKKMRPDAVIKYPDNRSVIIDSKVSLNAFTRYIAATDAEEQKQELAAHVSAVKSHIVSLSAKGYDDYDKALDFVLMFVPSEPAYIAALQGDPDLWNFAYDKRILLLSPTNLITSLKLIVDLWKREYQNQNAQAIAERGAKLYDKFVGFVANLEDVGEHLDKAQGKYAEAYKQLSTGNDNLVSQATKLKGLGLKNKKELPAGMAELAIQNDIESDETQN